MLVTIKTLLDAKRVFKLALIELKMKKVIKDGCSRTRKMNNHTIKEGQYDFTWRPTRTRGS